jgi:hypothetical protein
MHFNHLKTLIGIFFICAHFGAILYVLLLGVQYFTFDQELDVILLLAPLFSAFTLGIVTDFVKHRQSRARGPRVNGAFVFVSLFFPLVYTIAIFGLVYAYGPLGWIGKFDELRRGVAGCETIIGAALGIVMGTLFDIKTTPSAASTKSGG